MDYLSGLILQAAGAWWIYPALFVFCLIDGFLPVLPNATLIVALAALSETSGEPNLWILGATGALGAMAGDDIAYRISARIGTTGYRWTRKPVIDRALHRARFELDKSGAAVIFTGRYLPGGRTAVNFTAGATAYPLTTFMWLDAAAALTLRPVTASASASWAGNGSTITPFPRPRRQLSFPSWASSPITSSMAATEPSGQKKPVIKPTPRTRAEDGNVQDTRWPPIRERGASPNSSFTATSGHSLRLCSGGSTHGSCQIMAIAIIHVPARPRLMTGGAPSQP